MLLHEGAPQTPDQKYSLTQQLATLLHGRLLGRDGPNEHAENALCHDVSNGVADLLVHGGRGACQAHAPDDVYTKG
jgi:hypothetical protein